MAKHLHVHRVMPGLVPGIHEGKPATLIDSWMAGPSPAMTALM